MNPNNPNSALWTALTLVLMLVPATATAEPSSCNNYGVVFQAGLANEYECHAQFCEQGTGAGAGAGAGGPGQNDVGASASAGTSCSQNENTGAGGSGDPAEEVVRRVTS